VRTNVAPEKVHRLFHPVVCRHLNVSHGYAALTVDVNTCSKGGQLACRADQRVSFPATLAEMVQIARSFLSEWTVMVIRCVQLARENIF